MNFALHGMVTKHSNIISDIHIAAHTGYEGVELHSEKLWRYIESGGTSKDCKSELEHCNIKACAIDIIGNVECTDALAQKKMIREAEVLSKFASEIGTGTIQLNAFTGLDGLSIEDNIYITANNIRKICKIGADYGIRFQYEGAAWTPIHKLTDYLSLVDEIDMSNFGLVIDFWHFWASRGATFKEISALDKDIIYAVHCCGGARPSEEECDENGIIIWNDECEYRGYFPGDEKEVVHQGKDLLPVQEWVDAIISTGFDSWVSGEFLNEQLWERDNISNAKLMRARIEYFFNKNK